MNRTPFYAEIVTDITTWKSDLRFVHTCSVYSKSIYKTYLPKYL